MTYNDISKKNTIIQTDWSIQKVKTILQIKKELNTQENPTILSLSRNGIKVRDISTGEGQIASSYDNYHTVEKGDLLINPMDLTSGANCNVSYVKGVISPAYINLVPKIEVDTRYYNYYFKTQYWNNSFFAHGKGVSYENRWTLNNETLLNYYVPVPSYKEQVQISNFLDEKLEKIEKEIEGMKNTIDLLQEYKKVLINDAVTGKINIGDKYVK